MNSGNEIGVLGFGRYYNFDSLLKVNDQPNIGSLGKRITHIMDINVSFNKGEVLDPSVRDDADTLICEVMRGYPSGALTDGMVIAVHIFIRTCFMVLWAIELFIEKGDVQYKTIGIFQEEGR